MNPEDPLYVSPDISVQVDYGNKVLVVTSATATRFDAETAYKLADVIENAAQIASGLKCKHLVLTALFCYECNRND